MSRATYGSLIEEATRYMESGRRQVHVERFRDKQDAEIAVAAYYGLLDAAREHIWTLVGPARMAGVIASQHPHPIEATAVVLADVLQAGPEDAPPNPHVVTPPRHVWDHAGRFVRAASDLISSHVTITGGLRTPDAVVVLDEQARTAALGRIGSFIAALTTTQDALALRVGQTGVRWTKIGRWLPPAMRLQAAALAVVRVAEVTGTPAASDLDGLSPATASVRDRTPIDHLDGLVSRIRRAAWTLRERPDYSVRTLADIARAGFEVAVHTAVFHGVDLHDRQLAARDPNARRAAAWLAVMGDLRSYRGECPVDRAVHADVVAVHDLLATLVPRHRLDVDRGTSADFDDRRLGAVLHGACAALGQAAGWNATTLSRLARGGHVYVEVERLGRDRLSEDADLAAAKLTGSTPLVPAPTERIETTLDRYRAVTDAAASWSSREQMEGIDGTRQHAQEQDAHVLTRAAISS